MNNEASYEQILDRFGQMVYSIRGGSMRPFLYSDWDAVLIRAKGTQRCNKYDAVLYRRDNGQYVLHRIVEVCPDSYVLQGDNCLQREPGIREDQILGVLTGVIRKGITRDVSRPCYRTAVRIWCALRPVHLMAFGRNIWGSIKKRLN